MRRRGLLLGGPASWSLEQPSAPSSRALEQFFAALSWVAVGERVARAARQLARRHRGAYSGIDGADVPIAATSLLLKADLLTTNARNFPLVPGLEPPC